MNFLRIFSKINYLILGQDSKKSYWVIFLIIISGLFDAVGIASIMPFLYLALNPSSIFDIEIALFLYNLFGFSSETGFLAFLGLNVFGIFVFGLLVKASVLFVTTKFALSCEVKIAHRLMGEYLNKDYLWFVNENSIDLTKKTLTEVINVCDNGILTYLQLIAHFSVLLFMCAFLLFVSPTGSLVGLSVIFFVYFVIYNLFSGRVKAFGKGRYSSNQERFQILSEAVSNPRELKIYNSSETYKKHFLNASKLYADCNVKAQLYAGIPRFFIELIAFGSLLLVTSYLLVFEEDYLDRLPLIAVFALSAYRALPAVQQIYGSVIMLRFVEASVDEILADLDTALGARSDCETEFSSTSVPEIMDGALMLEEVVFKYPSKHSNALDKVSLRVDPGEHIGVVGHSGSGKSTFADICSGLLVPTSGRVYTTGVRLSPQSQEDWLTRIGYISQSVRLIDGTIKANIAFGQMEEEVDEAWLRRCAEVALADDFIRELLPDGYNTEVGENGLKLSGGQRQRIGIARALYKDPDLLIIDEGTSALDSILEERVISGLHEYFSNKTIIMISHNVQSLKKCDTIYFFEKGKVIDCGSYNKLLNKSTKFKELIKN